MGKGLAQELKSGLLEVVEFKLTTFRSLSVNPNHTVTSVFD